MGMMKSIFQSLRDDINVAGSTCLSKAEYNRNTGDMSIQFRNGNGKTYVYPGLTDDEVEEFKKFVSKGTGFHTIIRPHSTNL